MNIILADCDYSEVISLAEQLKFNNKRFLIKSHVSNWKRTGFISELRRYLIYFFVAFYYFISRKKFNVILGWQQFYALIFCFFCSVFKVKKRNIVIALNFTYKAKNGILSKLYKWFMTKCVSLEYLDYLHVPSINYAKMVSEEFNFPINKIIVSTFGINDDVSPDLLVPSGFNKNGFALAIGRSNRDYDFLCKAWESIDYPLVLISDTYNYSSKNKNITFLNNVSESESYNWIANCSLMIIPLDDGNICSGDTVLLRAMSLSRKIIVTAPSTLAEMYISDGVNALLVKKDFNDFQNRVKNVLFTSEFDNLGENARKCFLQNFSRSSMGKKINDIINQEGN